MNNTIYVKFKKSVLPYKLSRLTSGLVVELYFIICLDETRNAWLVFATDILFTEYQKDYWHYKQYSEHMNLFTAGYREETVN